MILGDVKIKEDQESPDEEMQKHPFNLLKELAVSIKPGIEFTAQRPQLTTQTWWYP